MNAMTVETMSDRPLAELVVDDAEVAALIRVLYVVKDNFWLDAAEESVLERLLETSERHPITRADRHARRHSHLRGLEHRGAHGARAS